MAKVELIRALAACVPKDRGHTVDLHNPDLVILVELYAVRLLELPFLRQYLMMMLLC